MTASSNANKGLKRPRYFDRQQLRAEDLMLGQDYVRQRFQRLNHQLHGCGVVCGLEIKAGQVNDGRFKIVISPGFALSPQGEEIWVGEEQSLEVPLPRTVPYHCEDLQCPAILEDQAVFIAVRYAEYQVHPMPAVPKDCGPMNNWQDSRICEGFEFGWLDQLPGGCQHQALGCGDLPDIIYGPGSFEGHSEAKQCCMPDESDNAEGSSRWIVLARISLDQSGHLKIDYSDRSTIIGTRYLDDILRFGTGGGLSAIVPNKGTQGEIVHANLYGWGLQHIDRVQMDGHGVRVELLSEKVAEMPHPSYATKAIYSPDGAQMATCCSSALTLWNSAEGTQRLQIGAMTALTDIMFSHDGQKIAALQTDGTIKVYSVASGQLLWQFQHGATAQRLSCSPLGPYLVVSGSTSRVTVWRIDNGQQLMQMNVAGFVRKQFISADGQFLWIFNQTNQIQRFGLLTGTNDYTFAPPAGKTVLSCELRGDGRYMAICYSGGEIALLDTASLQIMTTFNSDANTYLAAFSPDGYYLATAGYSSYIRLFSVMDGKPVRVIDSLLDNANATLEIVFSPDGKHIAKLNYYSREVSVWECASGGLVTTLEHDNTLLHVTFSPVYHRMVTVGYGLQASLWKIVTGTGNRLPVKVRIARTAPEGVRGFQLYGWDGRLENTPCSSAFTIEAASPAITAIQADNSVIGRSLSVTILGRNLAGSSRVVFPDGGITASILSSMEDAISVQLSISLNARLGNHSFEVTTPRGVLRSQDAGIFFRVLAIYYSHRTYMGGWTTGIGGRLL